MPCLYFQDGLPSGLYVILSARDSIQSKCQYFYVILIVVFHIWNTIELPFCCCCFCVCFGPFFNCRMLFKSMLILLLFPFYHSLLIEAAHGDFSWEVPSDFTLARCEQYALWIADTLVLKISDSAHCIVSAPVNTLQHRGRGRQYFCLDVCILYQLVLKLA